MSLCKTSLTRVRSVLNFTPGNNLRQQKAAYWTSQTQTTSILAKPKRVRAASSLSSSKMMWMTAKASGHRQALKPERTLTVLLHPIARVILVVRRPAQIITGLVSKIRRISCLKLLPGSPNKTLSTSRVMDPVSISSLVGNTSALRAMHLIWVLVSKAVNCQKSDQL